MSNARHLVTRTFSRRGLLGLGASVAAVATLGLAGCSQGASSAGGAAQPNLAFVYATNTLNPMQEMALGAQAAAADHKVNLAMSAPSGTDGPAQVQMLRQAATTATDGIAYQTLTPELFPRPIQEATDKKIPVIAVDTPPPAGVGVKTFVGTSDLVMGREVAKRILQEVPAGQGGTVVIGNAMPGLGILEARAEGIKQVVAEQRPDLKVVGPLATAPEPTANHAAWDAILQANPDAVAYLGTGAQDAVSLGQLQGTKGKNYLAGAPDLDPAALEALQAKRITALVSPEHWLKGYMAIDMLATQATGGAAAPEGTWDTGYLLVEEKNVTEIAARQKDEASRKEWFAKKVEEQKAAKDKHLGPLVEIG